MTIKHSFQKKPVWTQMNVICSGKWQITYWYWKKYFTKTLVLSVEIFFFKSIWEKFRGHGWVGHPINLSVVSVLTPPSRRLVSWCPPSPPRTTRQILSAPLAEYRGHRQQVPRPTGVWGNAVDAPQFWGRAPLPRSPKGYTIPYGAPVILTL